MNSRAISSYPVLSHLNLSLFLGYFHYSLIIIIEVILIERSENSVMSSVETFSMAWAAAVY